MLTNIICDPFDCNVWWYSIINQGDLQRIYQLFVLLIMKHGMQIRKKVWLCIKFYNSLCRIL
jgi:hypothetical protein